MFNFKDQLALDNSVFFNANEFADLHNLNGQQILCMVDTDIEKNRNGGQSQQYDGIFLSTVKIFVKTTDLRKKPAYGKLFKLDDKPYTVIDCAENGGIYEITLGLNNS